jgi:hypothetical protein
VELAELVDERLGQDVGAGTADLGGLGEGAGERERDAADLGGRDRVGPVPGGLRGGRAG